MTGFTLGDKVKFFSNRPQFVITADGKKICTGREMQEGDAIVLAICLDSDRRKIVQLRHADNEKDIFNVDYLSINPTDEFKEKYKLMCEAVKELSIAGNEKSKAIVAEHNKQIDEISNEVLGAPIEL